MIDLRGINMLEDEMRDRLEAKDKELAALRSEAHRWKDEHACSEINFQRALARAETAERERDEARAALKECLPWVSGRVGHITASKLAKIAARARAITGED